MGSAIFARARLWFIHSASPSSPSPLVSTGWPWIERIWCFAAPFSVTGQPAISLPIGQTAGGLPVGVQLVAALGREDLLLGVAAQLETAAPWGDRRPPLP